MKALKTFIFFTVFIITLFGMFNKPAIHKHFIITNENFKLKNINQRPQDLQSSVLFKLGTKRNNSIATEQRIQRNTTQISSEEKIIPSSIFSAFETNFISSSETSKVSQERRRRTDINRRNEEMVSQNVETSINQAPQTQEDMLKKLSELVENSSTSEELTLERLQKELSGRSSSLTGTTCPACSNKNDPRYKNETLAWNIWRSTLQNRIMDDSDGDGHYGTVFLFSFNVSKSGTISNLKITCTDRENKSVNQIRKAILNLGGQPVLNFPKGTNRKNVQFVGGFMLGSYAQYSTPADYSDFERIRVQY